MYTLFCFRRRKTDVGVTNSLGDFCYYGSEINSHLWKSNKKKVSEKFSEILEHRDYVEKIECEASLQIQCQRLLLSGSKQP